MSTLTPGVKTAISLSELSRFSHVDKVVIESLEQALFRVELEIGDRSYYLIESPGKGLTRRSIVEVQELLIPFKIKSMFLRHTSPYDEMIGMDAKTSSNELLVPLGNYFDEAAEVSGLVQH